MNAPLRNHDFGGAARAVPSGPRGGSRTQAVAGKRLQPAPLAGPVSSPHGGITHGGINRYRARVASAEMVARVKQAMKDDLRKLGGGTTSRTIAAERLTELLDRPVSETALNGLVAPSHEDRRLAASDVPGWCETVESFAVLKVIAEACGLTVVDARVAEAGMLVLQIARDLENLEDLGERVLTELLEARSAAPEVG